MNYPIHHALIAGAGILILLSAVAGTHAQQSGKPQPEEKQLKVMPIQHADIGNIYNVVSDLMQDKSLKMTLDAGTNSLIVLGHAVDLEAIEQLVSSLDKKGSTNVSERSAEVVNLNESPAEEVGEILRQVFTNNQLIPVRIAVNDRTNSVVLTGQPQAVKIASELIQQLVAASAGKADQQQSTNYQIRVTWLVDANGLEDTAFFDEPNESLKQLVDALREEGSMDLAKTLTTNQTSVQVGNPAQSASNKFNNTSLRHRNDGPVVLDVKGRVRGMSDNNMTLELSLNMSTGNATLSIGTTVILPLNHPVAFSISDVGDLKSVAVVEVLN